MPNNFTVKQIHEEIKVALGGSSITVELDEKDLIKSLADAVRLYNRSRPRRGHASLTVTKTKKKYGPLTHPNIQGVLDVQFITNQAQGGAVDPFDYEANGMNQILQGGGQTFGDLQQQLTYSEDARRIASAEPEWRGGWEGKDYFLYIDVPRDNILCSYHYSWHVEPTDDAVKGIFHIDDGDIDWIVKYATARAKQILSRVRGKFGGIATTEGSIDQTDAEALVAEGKEEQLELETEIKARRRPLPPVIE